MIEEIIMRRKTYLIAAALVSAVLLTGCGDKEFLKDIKAGDYVTLGNYKGIEASANAPHVEEADVAYFIQERYLTPVMLTKEEAAGPYRKGTPLISILWVIRMVLLSKEAQGKGTT